MLTINRNAHVRGDTLYLSERSDVDYPQNYGRGCGGFLGRSKQGHRL